MEDNKNIPNRKILLALLCFLFIGGVYAVTTISDTEIITTGNVTSANINNIFYVDIDDGSDIQTKINSCPTIGCLVILPPGNYTISEPIIINKSRVILRGSGYSTTIYITDTGEDGIVLGSPTAVETDYSGVENLRIIGKSTLDGDAFSTGTSLLIKNHKKGNFKDLLIYRGSIGINLLANGSGGFNTLNKFSDVEVSFMSSTGILINNNNAGDTTNFNNAQQFVNYYIHDNELQMNISRFNSTDSGEVAHNEFINGYFDDKNVSHSLLSIDGATNTNFVNTYFDGTGTLQLFINNLSSQTKFIASDFDLLISDNGTNTKYLNDNQGFLFKTGGGNVFELLQGGNMTTNGSVRLNSNNGETLISVQRAGSNTQSLSLQVDDSDVVFESIQDETSGTEGGFLFKMDSGGSLDPNFKINKGGTQIINIDSDGSLTIGAGTNQINITLTSPDGTEFDCGVSNAGALQCT